MVITLGVIVI